MLWNLLGLLIFSSWSSMADLPAPLETITTAKPGCQEKCGNLSIPYPFGLGDDPNCFQETKFQLYCNTTFDPPLLFMAGDSSTPIINLSLEGQLTILLWASTQCHSINGTISESPFYLTLGLIKPFKVSDTRNKFVAIGCDTIASITDLDEKHFESGCISYCTSAKNVINGSCTGIGCCQTSIPKDVDTINVTLSSYYEHQNSWNFSRCSYAFLADDQWFKFYGPSDLLSFPVMKRCMGISPVMLVGEIPIAPTQRMAQVTTAT